MSCILTLYLSQTREEWQGVFLIASLVHYGGVIFYGEIPVYSLVLLDGRDKIVGSNAFVFGHDSGISTPEIQLS